MLTSTSEVSVLGCGAIGSGMKLLREYAFNMPSPPTKNFWVDVLHKIHCMEDGANEKSARKVNALRKSKWLIKRKANGK